MKNICYLFCFYFGFIACEQESIATLDTSTAVVDAYIFVGQPIDSIRITQSFSYADADTNLVTLDQLEVRLKEGANSYTLQSIGNGYYQYSDLKIVEGKTYTLEFEYNSKKISASTYTPLTKLVSSSASEVALYKVDLTQGFGAASNLRANAETAPIELQWNNSEGDYYYVVVENLENKPEDIIILPDGTTLEGRQFQFISRPEIMDFYPIRVQRELQQFGKHRAIVYRVNPEYAALYELNGSSSVSITQPPSNINNGLGIFTGVSSDTVYFEVKKR